MNAVITGENEERVGVNLRDNNGVEHVIELEFDGEIKYHDQDGYPDQPAERTEEGNEHVNQTRRFAKYYVYTQRGYDTVPPRENPVRIDAVRQAINEMDLEQFEEFFGDLYQQLDYEMGGGSSPAMDVPPQASDPAIYSKNVYLGIDPLETDLGETLAIEHGLDIDESAADVDLSKVSGAKLEQWSEFTGEFTARAVGEDIDLDEAVYLDHVSDLYVQYPDGPDLAAADEHLEDQGREPDTVIELLPIEPADLADLKAFLDHYLKCQIRDTFVEMGVHPPDEFRVIGMGRFMASVGYENIDFYPEFHDSTAKAFH